MKVGGWGVSVPWTSVLDRFAGSGDAQGYLRWKKRAELSIAANGVLAAALFGAVLLHSTEYVVLARTGGGGEIRAQLLKEPVRTDAALRNWAVTAATEIFTLGHSDWEDRLGEVRKYFSESGYEAFNRRFRGSRFLEVLRSEFQKASAVAQGAPVIVGVALVEGGRRAWVLEFPMLITFEAGRDLARRRYVARVVVGRVPLGERLSGIGIESVTATRERQA